MNLLIVVPSFKILGGVANHYSGLSPFWSYKVNYCFQGKRPKIPALLTLIPDFINFIFKLIFKKIDVVLINPSLRTYQLKRDGIYLRIAKFFGKKVVTFFHGWDPTLADQLIKNPGNFIKIYGKSNLIFCLYSKFKDDLTKIGIKSPIILTSTKVADKLIDDFNISNRQGNIKTLLFLARLEKNKGIFITLDTFKILKKNYPDLKLIVCGSGGAEEEAQTYVSSNKLSDVIFRGNISGEKLIDAFTNSDLYILPTTHGEGMATSVLEAMAFGLPVITRPVGGVNDFFVNSKMGYLIESLNPEDYVKIVEQLINNPSLTKEISFNNYTFAKNNFMASEVVKKLERYISEYCS